MTTFHIPKKDCSEFIVIDRLWENTVERPERIYYVLGIIFAMAFFFMEYITGELGSPTAFGSMMNGVFLFLALYVFLYGHRTSRLMNTEYMKKKFIDDILKISCKKLKVNIVWYSDEKYTDTECDYLIFDMQVNTFIPYRVYIYVRGDVATEVVPFTHPNDWDKIDLDDVRRKLDMMKETATGGRKRAFILARRLLECNTDTFKEAFVRQPTYTLRFLEVLKKDVEGRYPKKEGFNEQIDDNRKSEYRDRY